LIGKFIEELAFNPPLELRAVIKLLGIAVQDQPYRDLIIRELKVFPNYEKRQGLLEAGHFSTQDFILLIHACGDGKGTGIQVITSLLQRLNEWGLVLDNGIISDNALVRYQWHKTRIAMFITLRILDNVLLGSGYVARKYRQSVPAVFIEKNGDQHTGTGFLATNRGDAKKYVVITAKHNIDPADGITFLGFSEPEGVSYKPLTESWVLHPKLDLALVPVEYSESHIPIFPLGAPIVLSRTITLGYPRIATTDAPYVLAHGGEMNAVVKTYYGEERLIISNSVAPGNSGGPVLDEAGLCLGIVVNAFETEHEDGVNKANAAIPSGPILDFIAPYCT